MAVIVVGVSHHGAPLDVRERLAFRGPDVLPALAHLREGGRTREGVLLSTCNRTELYLAGIAPHRRHRTGRVRIRPATAGMSS